MERTLPTTREMKERLTQLLNDVNSLLVNRWLNDASEKPEDVGETVGLMLQVVAGLTGEIDAFIGGVDSWKAYAKTEAKPAPVLADETEMQDLVTDEPVSSMISEDAPFEFAEGTG